MATISDQQTVPASLRQLQRGVSHRLQRIRRRIRAQLVASGVFWTIMSVVLMAIATLLIDLAFRFDLLTRQLLLVLVLGGIAAVIFRRLVRPSMVSLDDLDLAELLDRRVPGVGQKISNVLQLPDLLQSKYAASPAMIEADVIDCAQSLDRVDLQAPLNTPRFGKLLAGCVGWILLAASVALIWPATTQLWARRWLAGSDIRWPQQTYLGVMGLTDDGKLLVPRGELSLLQINSQPKAQAVKDGWLIEGRERTLVVESSEPPQSRTPEKVAISYRLPDGNSKRGNAVQLGEALFSYELAPLAEPVELHITGGDDWLGPIQVVPIDRPTVDSLKITALPPGQSEPETITVGEGTTQHLYLRETKLTLTLVSNQPLKSAEALSDGAQVPGWERVDDHTYQLTWTMQQPLALEFRLTGTRGNLTSKPYFLTIGLLRDREPRLTLRSSGVGRRVTPVARIPLAMRATDDFGVQTLGLEIERTRLQEDKPETESSDLAIPLGEAPPDAPSRIDVAIDYELALADRQFAPGNLIKLRSMATDNSALGIQTGHSRWLSFQVVSADELFYEILTRQREQRAKFKQAVDSAKEQSAAIESLTTRDETIAVARAESVISRQVWQIATQLDASLVEMTLNDLGNPAAREIMQSGIITPLETLHGELLERLRGTLGELAAQEPVSEDGRAEALRISRQAVEVMEAILAQMAQWESFVDVINQLKHVIEAQNKVLESTEELEKKRTLDLFDE